jgi:hypothetical protein
LQILDTAQAISGFLVDVALSPAQVLPDNWQWVWAALLTGVGLTGLWQRLLSLSRLRSALSRAWTGLLMVWLFRHEPGAAAHAQVRALRASLSLLFWLLLPGVVSMAIAAPFLVHLQPRYGYRPLTPGDSIVVHVTCADAAAAGRLQMDWPDAAGKVEVLIHEPATASVVARLATVGPGHSLLLVSTGGAAVSVPVSVGLPPTAVELGPSLLLSTGIVHILIGYAPVSWSWWLLFGCVSCVGAAGVWLLGLGFAAYRRYLPLPRDRTVPAA